VAARSTSFIAAPNVVVVASAISNSAVADVSCNRCANHTSRPSHHDFNRRTSANNACNRS